MRNLRLISLLSVVVAVGGLWPRTTEAVPVFAREYGFNCTMCHSSVPRLNDYGERFRQNGYQLPGRESEGRTILQGPPPFAVRVSGGYTSYTTENMTDSKELSEFLMNGVDVFSSGLLAPDVGYFVVLLPEMKEARGVEGQDGTLESGNVIFSNLGTPWLNVRAGRMEPASTAFSVKRKMTVSPYEVYSFGAPGVVTLADTQDGVEVSGHGRGLVYAVGYLNGSENNAADDAPQDAYARASVVVGAGEGQTAGQRIGVVGYAGRSRPAPSPVAEPAATLASAGDPVAARPAEAPDQRENLGRYGLDASLNLGPWNLAILYLQGNDDHTLWGTDKDVQFTGGFAELSVMPCTHVVMLGRFDWVDTPGDIDQDVTRWTGGARFYVVDNLALHAEYSHRRQDQPEGPTATEDFTTLRMDLAF